ncbi:hypothetical protein K439DRAFT_1622797 [Ramaria rubella]|nr:hypothetical protein K439DRAFT_1622797 [Ramaria rubella]
MCGPSGSGKSAVKLDNSKSSVKIPSDSGVVHGPSDSGKSTVKPDISSNLITKSIEIQDRIALSRHGEMWTYQVHPQAQSPTVTGHLLIRHAALIGVIDDSIPVL